MSKLKSQRVNTQIDQDKYLDIKISRYCGADVLFTRI